MLRADRAESLDKVFLDRLVVIEPFSVLRTVIRLCLPQEVVDDTGDFLARLEYAFRPEYGRRNGPVATALIVCFQDRPSISAKPSCSWFSISFPSARLRLHRPHARLEIWPSTIFTVPADIDAERLLDRDNAPLGVFAVLIDVSLQSVASPSFAALLTPESYASSM